MDEFQVQMENNSEIEVVLQANNVAKISEDEDLCGNVVISIKEMLKQLPPVTGESSIYRVPKELREMNPQAYTPQLISIGPFHHGCQKDFRATEQYKLRALINFLRRINNNNEMESLKVLVEKAHCWVKEARNCYAEPINMKDHEFLMMMLVDACFIVELFIQKYDKFQKDSDRRFDQIQDNNIYFSLVYPENPQAIFYDLIKLENQVPFFLLRHMFHLIPEDSRPVCFINLTYVVLRVGFIRRRTICSLAYSKEPKHLVDFLSFYFLPLPSDKQNKQDEKNSENKNNFSSFFHALFPACWQKQNEENSEKKNNGFLSFFRVPLCRLWNKKKADKKNREKGRLIPPSITKLHEAGVIINKAEENDKYVMNITFKNGVLEIPPLHIYDDFELVLRNMVAFEQFLTGNKNKYVIQYVSFMDDLISTEKDVSLLAKAGVIINNIGGSDKEVSDLFNNLGKFVTISSTSHFDPISTALREHCNGRWNKAKASLKHNYFNTPWAGISVFAATVLILLTLLQTIFSGISAFPN